MSSVPSEYSEAYDAIVKFRQKVFQELVAGRIKAKLDSNHETLIKYGDVIDKLSVVPYIFGNVKQKALALKLGGLDISEGGIAQAKASFVIGKGEYPLGSEPKVSSRLLPEVDVFLYTPPTDLSLIEKSTEAIWSNLFILQGDSKQFSNVSDVSNSFFDYYKLKPVGRVKCEVILSDPKAEFTNWTKLTGEATFLVRSLTPKDTVLIDDYDIHVMIDANYHGEDNTITMVPLVIIVTSSMSANPKAVVVAGGKRIFTDDKGVFAGFVKEGQFVGFAKTHDDYTLSISDTLWANSTKLTINVNDQMMGTVDPPPATYDKKATESVLVTAYPNVGYDVKNWELNGGQYPSSDTFTVKCYDDRVLICVFCAGGIQVMRPNANGDVIQLKGWGDSPNYKCVDEEYSDGDITCVSNEVYDTHRYDLYKLSAPTIPDGNIIDYVDVFARVRTKNPLKQYPANIVIKTNGVVVHDIDYYPDMQYLLLTKRFTLNPVTSAVWTKSEVLALQAGVRLYFKQFVPPPEPYDGICTQVWVEVNHYAP